MFSRPSFTPWVQLQVTANPWALVGQVVLHLGQVQLGGLLNKGEGNLSGTAVNFIFKAEKLVDSIDQRTFISAVAAKEMPGAPLKTLGTFKVPGFPGESEFHALETERA